MKIIANGEDYEIEAKSSLLTFLESKGLSPDRVVVERNGIAMTPSETRKCVLEENDRLEIVRIVAGG